MAIPCASPFAGRTTSKLTGKKRKNLAIRQKKARRRHGFFIVSIFRMPPGLSSPPHPPFPAGRVFTGAACGGGSPMRKGVCYAMLYYAMLCYSMLCVPKYTFSAFMADFCNI